MWKAENASGGKRILLNYEEVRYMQFESNSGFVVKKNWGQDQGQSSLADEMSQGHQKRD